VQNEPRESSPMTDPSPKPKSSLAKCACLPCLAILLLACLGGGGITLGVFGLLKESPPYKDGVARAVADPRLREALGEPVTVGWWVGGTLRDNGNHGSATFQIPLEGPRGQATLDVAASKSQGTWTTGRAKVTLTSGEIIDLLEPAPEPEKAGPLAPSKSEPR